MEGRERKKEGRKGEREGREKRRKERRKGGEIEGKAFNVRNFI